ncbi:MAG: MTAP family purine nucleoside phosphorylase [Candidatus Glassbacteria bacterium]
MSNRLSKAPADYRGFAVIGGSGAHSIDLEKTGAPAGVLEVDTPFGRAGGLRFFRIEGTGGCLAFLARHGETGYEVGAWDVNYRANIWALKQIGTRRILSWSGPGAIDKRFTPGDYVLPDDLIDLTRRREDSFYRGTGLGFIRQNPVFCPAMAEALESCLDESGVTFHRGGVYAVTEGPRLETAAEVRMLGQLGAQLVGMTLAPEAFLARELEICYHPLCYVANRAEGVKPLPYKPGELFEGMLEENLRSRVEMAVAGFARIVKLAAGCFADPAGATEGRCPCPQAMLRYRREGRIGEDWHTWIGGEK